MCRSTKPGVTSIPVASITRTASPLTFPTAAITPLTVALPPSGWRTVEVTTRVEVLKPAGTTYVWLPAAIPRETPFQKTLSNEFRAEGGAAELMKDEKQALAFVSAKFPEGVRPVLTLTCKAQTYGMIQQLSYEIVEFVPGKQFREKMVAGPPK